MRLSHIYSLLIRFFLGYVFVSAGLCKLTEGQFGELIGPPTAAQTPGLERFWPFLAALQVAVGALVLSGRWALAGLLALVPLNLGILAYTLIHRWTGTPFVNGFFLLLNLLALAADWRTLRFLFSPDRIEYLALPRSVGLWPGWRLPLLTLVLFAAAVLSAGVFPKLAVGLGVLALITAWAHALQPTKLNRLDRIALTLPGIAVVLLSVAPVFNKLLVPFAMLLGLVAGTLALGLITGQRALAPPQR